MRPAAIDKYLQISQDLNRLKKEKESLRPEVFKILNETGGFEDVYIGSRTTTTWNEDVIYEWLSKNHPDLIPELSKVTVDIEKFAHCVRTGIISQDSLPLDIFNQETTQEIRTARKTNEIKSS
jgi:hypothetical protein